MRLGRAETHTRAPALELRHLVKQCSDIGLAEEAAEGYEALLPELGVASVQQCGTSWLIQAVYWIFAQVHELRGATAGLSASQSRLCQQHASTGIHGYRSVVIYPDHTYMRIPTLNSYKFVSHTQAPRSLLAMTMMGAAPPFRVFIGATLWLSAVRPSHAAIVRAPTLPIVAAAHSLPARAAAIASALPEDDNSAHEAVEVFEFGEGGMDVDDLLAAFCEEGDDALDAFGIAEPSSPPSDSALTLSEGDWLLPPSALPLTEAAGAAQQVEEVGVVRVRTLPRALAAELRDEVLGQLERARQAEPAAAERSGGPTDLFSRVLAPSGLEGGAEEVRWDVRMQATPVVRAALRHAFVANVATDTADGGGGDSRGDLGAIFTTLAGRDAELWELAALVSAPGACAQPVHADTLSSPSPCLFTAFIALQRVEEANGPTRFLPHSHTAEAHAPRGALEERAYVASAESCLALLEPGDATIYDGRLRHSGSGNTSGDVRVLFYVTFRHEADDERTVGMRANGAAHSIRPEYAGRVRLGHLLADQVDWPL
jgi:hypothetical protein